MLNPSAIFQCKPLQNYLTREVPNLDQYSQLLLYKVVDHKIYSTSNYPI